MRRLSLLCLVSFAGPVTALVQLNYSQLFDQEDFKGQSEIVLTKCSQGCVVYAAAPAATVNDPYQRDIILVKKVNVGQPVNIMDLHDLAQLRSADPDQPYLRRATILDGGFQYSFFNRNPAGTIGALAIYVVASTIPNLPFPASVPIYDIPSSKPPFHGSGIKLAGNGQAFSVLSTHAFTLAGLQLTEVKNLQIRTTGYDGIMEKTCKTLYATALLKNNTTLHLPIRSPLLTVTWANAQAYTVTLKRDVEDLINFELHDISAVTSYGYIGCGSGIGNFRSLYDVNETTSTIFNSHESLGVYFAADHDLQQGDWLKVDGNGVTMQVTYNGTNTAPDTFQQDGTAFTVSWKTKFPQSQWAIVLTAEGVLPPIGPWTPNPDTSTKAASALQVTLLALISLLGAASAFH